jgi:defect-in-organelle-trafficking protein DotC
MSLQTVALLLGLSLALSGCSHSPSKTSTTDNNTLSDLKNMDQKAGADTQINAIRFISLRDTALSLGARAGLAARAKVINQTVDRYDAVLARIFNFNALMLDDNVVPPVLAQGRYSLALQQDTVQALMLLKNVNQPQFSQVLSKLGMDQGNITDALNASDAQLPAMLGNLNLAESAADQNALKIADRNYQIVSQAHFATTPPIWQDYLHMQHEAPETPDKSLLPKDKMEKKVWDQYVQDGWQAGIDQANLIFVENLGRLKRDYTGMVLYRSLLAQNIVSKPYVAKIDLGITGSGSDMSVNERILRITALPRLQLNGQEWKTDVVSK